MTTIWGDLRYATRILIRTPMFNVVTVLSLALSVAWWLGIGRSLSIVH